METIFRAYARYNKNVNLDVLKLVEPLTQQQLTQKFSTYYPSIFDTLVHVLQSDINWIKRFLTIFGPSPSLGRTGLQSYDQARLKAEVAEDYTRFFALRREADQVLDDFIQELHGGDFNKILRYKNFRGEDMEKELWKILLQVFNHQTHHRGQVSALLDQLGIEHDFSAVLPRMN